ncbi:MULTISPECIES: DUF3078 domain-containing protein [Roseivirga]|jgi:hypothetical protein|uniref:DUF3078 domain-containing protein n=2 Tax=Roseivirga TaxID=290180 RepID=A0A150WXJ5_9BACT|nr:MULTISPECIES: DUF3078 domain-containing protein [Roseivirga]PWL31243.1 MAG: DUF3078 domain-containing protein [Roseivirga sp. XM-24bin3]KYG71203.1 hypothetical protein AWW68_18515 [Roseivirga spongicola]MBO6660669.1 DUF3078 domain-containing protein [Roseivirga sp.]MBO6760802.1 DUF3078 domain-containing protein [Roseivirga sp.]MBO6910348.1 DUF3078 domain-containing protein [Roseivirga sp.]
MFQKTLLFLSFFLCFHLAWAQEQEADSTLLPRPEIINPEDTITYWKNGGNFNLNIQQVGLTNWAAGGSSSLAIGGIVEGFTNYEREEVVWENKLKIGYGIIRNGDNSNRFEKTDDAVILNSKYSQKMSQEILMTATINFRTQMDEGVKLETVSGQSEKRRVLISDFMAPGYLQASLGLTYKPTDWGLTATLAPFAGRFTFVLNDSLATAGSFGVAAGERIRSEAGISLIGSFKKTLMKNVEFETNYNFFSNYEKFPNTVVNVEASLNLKVNDFIQSKINTQLIYDDDVKVTRSDGTRGRDIQLKNVITVGFILKF